MKKLALLVMASVSILGLTACGGSSTSTTAAAPAKVYAIGEPILTDKYELIVTKVEEKAQVGIPYAMEKASEGGVIVGVQYSIKNVSAKPMNSFEQPTLKLIDGAGTEYDSDAAKTGSYNMQVDPNQKIISDLNPGIKVKGATAFEVSKELFKKDTWTLKTSDGAVISLVPAAPPAAAPTSDKK